MRTKGDKNEIIERIKSFYGFKTNYELAQFLGVAPNTISGWIKRNSIDYDLIFSTCEGIDFNWLLSGTSSQHHLISPNDVIGNTYPFTQEEFTNVQETSGEFALINYLYKRLNLKPIKSKALEELAMLGMLADNYILELNFSKIYNKYRNDKDINSLCDSFITLYKKSAACADLLKPQEETISVLSHILMGFSLEQDPIPILDELEEQEKKGIHP